MSKPRKIWRILHISSGEIVELFNSQSKGVKQFREEFKLILEFAKAPIECDKDVELLHEAIRKKLNRMGLNYPRQENPLDGWPGLSFSDWILELHIISEEETDDACKVHWEDFIESEFEILL